MKKIIPGLKLGDVVEARVVEVVSVSGLIVSFYGDLIRVENQSRSYFDVGQKISLRVIRVRPLSFQMLKRSQGFDRLV